LSKKHLLFLHPSSDLYGADRSLLRTVKAAATISPNITVCLPYDGPLVAELEKLSVEVKVFKLAVLRRKYFNPLGILSFCFLFLIAYFRLITICINRRTQLIHSNTSAVLVGGFVSKTLGITHLWHLREIHVNPKIIRKVVSWCYRNLSTKVIGVSGSTIDNLKIDSPTIWEKSVIINNGINIERYQSSNSHLRKDLQLPEDAILVGMIARVSHWKGQDLFLDIASQILPKFQQVHFLALGSPFQGQEYLMAEFEERAKNLVGNDRFHIHSFSPDVNEYLDAFDIFILPSTLPDPFPTTALEAMATRNAMIVNGQGGVLEMIDHKHSGFIVEPPNDVDAFIHYTEVLINDKELRVEMGKNAFEKAQKCFTEEIYVKSISDLIRSYL
jgi:glycosyltransferase involved in cell wall biosynthesis